MKIGQFVLAALCDSVGDDKNRAARTSKCTFSLLKCGCEIVTRRDDHFVVLLPETGRENAAAEEREAGDVAEKARLAGAFNRLPTDAQELLLLTRLADHTRLEVDARGTIHTALLSCPLVQPIGPRKGSVQGYPWGDYFQYDLLDVGIERVDALLAKLKEEEPTTYAELETRAKRRR